MLNDEFKSIGKWPSIGEAVHSGKRVFVFVRYNPEELISSVNRN